MHWEAIDRHLACRIARAIDEAGLTPEIAAEKLGLRIEDYLAVEQARVRIGAFMIARVASVTRKPVGWFFEGLPGQQIFDRE